MAEAYMKAPKKVPWNEFNGTVDKWLADNTYNEGEVTKHKDCGGIIKYYEAYMSEHDFPAESLCAGSGRVQKLTLPACVVCTKTPPFEQGCVHPPSVGTQETPDQKSKLRSLLTKLINE
jgi:hypothetical protein